MARPRVTIRTRDGTAWGYLDANELGTYNKDLVAKVGAAFGLGDTTIWEQARTEDGGLQLFATNEDFLELKQAVADLAAAKEEETSHAGGGATSDDPVDSFLAMAGTFLAAAEQQWAEPPPPTPEAGVTSLEVPEPLVEPIEGQEQLEVTTPPHPATLPPPIGLTVRPPPVEAGGQVDASPLPLSPPSNKKRGVLGQLSANLSRVFSPRRKPATPDADADAQVAASAAVSTPPPQPPRGINPPDTGERDLALMGFE
ncbi:hypothetical protein EMIHUDRAFT_448670 [Emiliania huxleyi CCMP1516]|uniref:PB1 domain-containing protein n=2 Tax=Emiliania huxleyi TaxID=2903 RepID=A0A0D3I2I6_EMIH1|nr:hypothetical protein EMIHUDRAFT_448670 [Emiliania huxleyi CCMP1516]EOD05471.1 hypothetical protein EMIHUDRAFT_448670 [Emiliania huxleyi CCMP1516]|eukprot:XP_005757900.1 hypothetical protein EMIHUDRAFT_448670 [Emiliania huxleyi CCMP1516]